MSSSATTTWGERRAAAQREANAGVNDPAAFDRMDEAARGALLAWIAAALRPRKTANPAYTSYGLKHVFERAGPWGPNGTERPRGYARLRDTLAVRDSFYVTNGQFKGAMVAAGYPPVDPAALNWVFRFRWARPGEGRPDGP